MKVHELKTWVEPFTAMWLDDKRHEFRKNDRDFKVGDLLHLREFDQATSEYTGVAILARVTYIGTGFGIPDEYVCMSVRVLSKE